MKSKIFLLAVIAGLALLIFACEKDSRSEVEKTAMKYLEAMDQHDIETLKSMTDPDVVIVRGRSRVTGRDVFLAPVEFEAGVNSTFEYTNIVVKGDTVDVDMVESNDLASVLGFPEFHHFPRFIFSDGLLVRRESRRGTPELRAYAQQMEMMRTWLKAERPDIVRQIEDDDGRYKMTRETGERLVKAAHEWRAAMARE